jgi:formyl-CoA transferase
MLNCNKRSLTLNIKCDEGKEIFAQLLQCSDVLVENFSPGALDRAGFTWERIQEINPRLIYASLKGFGPGRLGHAKAYEPIAQATGGAMSTTGELDGEPMVTGAQIGDSGNAVHLFGAICAALYQRTRTKRGQRVQIAMQHGIMNLCRVKFRDHQRLIHGSLGEYPNETFGDYTPRSGNASGGGHPGGLVRCKGGGPDDYLYLVVQPTVWASLARRIRRAELADDPAWSTPEVRLPKFAEVLAMIEEYTQHLSKWEAYDQLNAIDVACGPVLSTKDILEDPDLERVGMVVEIAHPERGPFKTIGCPFTLSDSPVKITRSPLLGEHNREVLTELLGASASDLERLKAAGAIAWP